jgi:hypothetical protein
MSTQEPHVQNIAAHWEIKLRHILQEVGRICKTRNHLKGKTHQAAVRALAFKWIRILFRCWQERTSYDESVYLQALHRRGSSLIQNLAKEVTGCEF